ncbi:hypothetical protein ACG83_10465 [Frankia sp. R43]|uniref:ImmA/IrrE family metallo-endopeptidase n=1 Tax=Frankia sp. R43 TaxID=269536 RepID=UPI0006CA4225|nr:ImmA/IrrE family metallo-endopeptidase [Frankia sp. R43]KPM55698.1 hypothetical protein ACG83_10465 [Frankia sp. R43]
MSTDTRKRTSRSSSKSRYALTPEQRAERIETARAQLAAGVERLTTETGWRQFLASRRWLNYSVGNQIMILMQCPDATDVRPLKAWNDAGCRMRKGETQIKIWKPTSSRVQLQQQDTPAEGTASEPGAEPKTATLVQRGFILVPVVDVSQLVEPPARVDPELPVELRGDAPAGLWDGLARQVAAAGYAIERGSAGGDGRAYGHVNHETRVVRIREGVDPAQAAKTLCHELAHVLLGHTADMSGHVREVEAESVACIVADLCGLDTLAYSVPYVAHWAGEGDGAVKASAQRVADTAERILAELGVERPRRGAERAEEAA